MRAKKKSKVLVDGEMRAAAARSIHDALDFGDGVSVKALEKANVKLAATLAAYNRTLADAESQRLQLKIDEAAVDDLSARILSGVAMRYGRDSVQYGQAGGKKTSERKRRGERKKEREARRQERSAPPSAAARQGAATGVGGDSSSTAATP